MNSLAVWAAEAEPGNIPPLIESELAFKDDSDLEAVYQKMLVVIAVFVAIFFAVFMANKKFKLFDGLGKSTSGDGLITVKDVKRISPKTVVYVLNINGQDKVIVESVANIDKFDFSKENNIKDEV